MSYLPKKKNDDELTNYNNQWKTLELEYFNLFNKFKNYVNIYFHNKDKNKLPSVKNDDDKTILKNISKYLQISVNEKNIKSVLEKNAELAELYRMKKPGVSNDNWVFNKISNNINSEIFYYHVNEVGYKRTKVKIKIRENELFELDAKGKLKLDKKLLKKIREDIKWQ